MFWSLTHVLIGLHSIAKLLASGISVKTQTNAKRRINYCIGAMTLTDVLPLKFNHIAFKA